jgi:hypothetical protein
MSRLALVFSGIQVMGRARWRELRALVGLRRATEMAGRYALLARHQLFEPEWYMAPTRCCTSWSRAGARAATPARASTSTTTGPAMPTWRAAASTRCCTT